MVIHHSLRALAVLTLVSTFAVEQVGHAAAVVVPIDELSGSAQAIAEILAQPEDAIDFARAKLAIDHLIDPTIDVDATLLELDRMVFEIEAMVPTGAPDRQILAAIRQYIYEPGQWNDEHAFAYDMDDPLGTRIQNKLLPTYLETRLGNCVSMPALFLILADRLGLDVTLSRAPNHLFMIFTDSETGQSFNIETTSGGFPARDIWYRENMPMTDTAVANGVFLGALTRRNSVGLLAETLIAHHEESGDYQAAIDLGNVIFAHDPTDAVTLIGIGSSYYKLLEREFYSLYPEPGDVPPDQRARYRYLDDMNFRAINHALALGWREEGHPDLSVGE